MARRQAGRIVLLGLAVAVALSLGACSPPPALTQKQFDAKKTPKQHPKLTAKQKSDCTVCHRVVATPKKP